MYIYHYSKDTLEYLNKTRAEADPAESKKQGVFVALIPAYATTIEPPTAGDNEAAIFIEGAWAIVPDYRSTHKKCDDEFKISNITTLGELTDGYMVTNELAELITANPDDYKISDGVVTAKTSEDKAAEFKETFEEQFFETSLGWIRRNVTMADGSVKSFLTDLLLPIKAGLELGQTVTVITYNTPDYTQEYTDEYIISLQEKKEAAADFVYECLLRLTADFGG